MFASLAETLSAWSAAFARKVHLDLTIDTSLTLLWVITAAIVSILAGGSISAFVRKKLAEREQAAALAGPPSPDDIVPAIKPPSVWQRLCVRALPLVAPFLNVLFAMMGALTLRKLGYSTAFLADLQPLLLSWLFITLVFVVTESKGKTIFVGILLVPFCMPFVQPYVREAATGLNELSLTVGKTTITALMIVQLVITGVLLMWIATAVRDTINTSLGRLTHMRWSTRQLLQNLSTIIVYMLAILIGLSLLGIDLTAFAVLGGALGVGIGLGLQKIASNFISGLILLSEQSIQVNDLIEVGSSGVTGLVRHTGARYTLIETLDRREIMIPNDDLVTSRVTNWTYTDAQGVLKIDIGVSYESDIELARDQLLAAAAAHPAVLKKPQPACILKGFGASSVDFSLTFSVKDVRERRAGIQSEVLFDIWHRFKKNNIDIPYPQMTVHYAGVAAPPQQQDQAGAPKDTPA